MKKTIILIVICCCLIAGIKASFSYSQRRFVDHKDVGSYLNVDELNPDKLTMLHFYSGDITIESVENKSVDFIRFDLVSPLSIYVNKILVVQNYLEDYIGYTNKKYIRYSIKESDYINNKATTLIEIEPTQKNEYATFFVGSYAEVNDLIITYNVIRLVACFLLTVSLVVLLIFRKKDKWLIIYFLSYLVLFYNFQYGLVAVTISLYLLNNQLIKNRWRIYIIILMTSCGLFLIEYSTVIIFAVMIQIYGYYKKESTAKFIMTISLAILWRIANYNLEFHLLMVYRKELYLLVFAITNFLNIEKIHFSKNDTVSLKLLSGINHDLKIPISVLKLNNEMLSNNIFETEVKKNKILASSDTAIRDLENMVGSVSAYVSKKDFISKYYQSSVIESILKAERNFRGLEKKVDFTVDCDTEDTMLPIDSIWLDRLFYNLLDNSFKYTKDYGTVRLIYKKQNNHINLRIEDSGIGMTKEQINNVMKPFYRASDSRSISGLGLGLSIVGNIVSDLNGDISIESIYGEGTIIKIRI